MLLKDYIPNVNKKFGNIFFSGISFNSSKLKKNNIFLLSKAIKLTETILPRLQLKKAQELLLLKKKLKNFKMGFCLFIPKILENYCLKFHLKFLIEYQKI